MSCPVCYTDDADIVVCWNEHKLCETCYRECLKPRVRNDEIAGVDKYHINDKCPTCREPMFDWYNLVVENMNNTMIAPVRQRIQVRNIDTRIRTIEEIVRIIFGRELLEPQQSRQAQPQPVRQPRTCRCGICGNTGHNRRTCPIIRT